MPDYIKKNYIQEDVSYPEVVYDNSFVKTYKDINLNFLIHPKTKDVATKNDKFAIFQRLRTLLRTRRYECLFHPEVGVDIESFMFENMTPLTLESVKTRINDSISQSEPRIEVKEVILEYSGNSLNIDIVFTFLNQKEEYTYTDIIERVR